jgi:hypothetical protein
MSTAGAVGIVLAVLAITLAPLLLSRPLNRRARLYFQLRCGFMALLLVGGVVSGSWSGVGGAMIAVGFFGYAAVLVTRRRFGLGRSSTASGA